MCHTDFMKKSLLLFVPVLIALSSCDQLRVGYVNESHSAGFADSRSSTSNVNSYVYFNGDTINSANPNVGHVTFESPNTSSNMAKEDVAALINCDVVGLFNEVVDASYVGTKKDTGLFIGYDSTIVDGYLTLSFKYNIKDVVIKACPYYTGEIVGFTDRVEHDENVAIAINDSDYFKLTYSLNSETNEVNLQEGRYHILENDVKQLNIKVGPQRAFIKEITVYYSLN